MFVRGRVWEATEEEQPGADVILHFPLLSPESPGHHPKKLLGQWSAIRSAESDISVADNN